MAGELGGTKAGQLIFEMDLDRSKMERGLQDVLASTEQKAVTIDRAWKNLGTKTDETFNRMKANAIVSYEAIAKAGFKSADEQARAMATMATKVEAINAKQYAVQIAQNKSLEAEQSKMWSTIGIRSMAAIKEQMDQVEISSRTLLAKTQQGSQDWINIEKAKNAKLKELSNEMVGHHEMSMAAITRAVLRAYAAYFVLSQGIDLMLVPLQKGFNAVEDYNKSVAGMAAMVMTFSEKQPGITMEQSWKEALKYSSAMVPVLENIAAKTLLSGEETTALANAFARSGVFLNSNNAAQVEAFTRISNALPLMTQGQEIMRQINTEVRSLMTGANEQTSMLLTSLKAINPNIENDLKTWRQTGTVFEHIGEMLVGFGPATDLLENSWQAVKSTIDTTVTQSLRGAMKPAYEEIIKLTKEFNTWLVKNQDELQKTASGIWGYLKKSAEIGKELASLGNLSFSSIREMPL